MRSALTLCVAISGFYGAATSAGASAATFDDLFDFNSGEYFEPPGGHIAGLLVAESVNAAPDPEASLPRRPLEPIIIDVCERLDPDDVRVSVTGSLGLDSTRAKAQSQGSGTVEWVFEARRSMCRQTLGVWRGVRLYPPWGGLHNATHFLEHWGGPGLPHPDNKPDEVERNIPAAFVGLQYGFQPNSYFHFMANGLDMVLRSRNLDRDLPIITNGNSHPNHFTSAVFDFLGLRDRVVLYDRKAVWHIGLALIPRHTMLSPYAEDLQRLRGSLLAPLGDDSGDAMPPLAVVIRREGSRGLANGEALEATVAEWGEVAVHLASMSFVEQRRIFARATLVVGTCGAGMTNLVLSRAQKVVELQPASPSQRLMTLYAELAHRALGATVEYHILGVEDERGVHGATNFLAPIPELRRALGLSQVDLEL